MTPNSEKKKSNSFIEAWSTTKRAFDEFLSVPLIIITGFLLLAVISSFLDQGNITWIADFRAFMQQHIFTSSDATRSLLGAIAAGLITLSSFSISLLLIVVQQSAASMTTEVFDQFLRSRINQCIFGFFVGLSLYALIVLATVSDKLNPVIGGTIAFLLTVIALILLIILVYSTINQMRPSVIIESVQRHIIASRKEQAALLAVTRRHAEFEGKISCAVHSERHGYIIAIHKNILRIATDEISGKTEIVYKVSIGDYLSVHDEFATVKADNRDDCEKMIRAVYAATEMDLQRRTSNDPGDGIEQIEMISWTNVSTSKSNPFPGILGIRAIRNLLTQWHDVEIDTDKEVMPVVYNDYSADRLLNTLETLAVTSSESMQHQVFLEVVHTFVIIFDRLEAQQQKRVEDIILRILSAMGDLVLTGPLDQELTQLIKVLRSNAREATANAVEYAQLQLRKSIGKLNSRATRTGSQ